MKRTLTTALAVALTVFSGVAAAQAIKDPTRPPAGFAGAGEPAAQTAAGGPVLQSIMLSPARRTAIISGQLVSRGEYYGDALLAEVAEDHVVLNRGGSVQVLKMYPGAEKKYPDAEKRKPK